MEIWMVRKLNVNFGYDGEICKVSEDTNKIVMTLWTLNDKSDFLLSPRLNMDVKINQANNEDYDS